MAKQALRRLFSPTLGVARSEPVLAWMVRGIPWLRESRATRAGVLAFSIGFGLIAALAVAFAFSATELPVALLLVIAGVRVVLDTATLARSWGRVGEEYRTGRWDLLRLTAQSEGALLRAHYAAAYASVWRLLLAALGAQTAATLIIMLSNFTQIARSPQSSPFAWLAAISGITLFTVELMARPRALVALGLALSASAPRAGSAAVLGSMALLVFWAAQGAALFTGFMLASAMLWGASEEWTWLAFGIFLLPLTVDWFVQRAALYRLAVAVDARDAAV
ncbi:MAG: hypothetical protein U0452_15370 [Anaerolineae bacterium]